MAKDKKQLRANGHINIPNVGANSECITLTYTIRGLSSIKQLEQIGDALNDLTEQEGIVNLEILGLKTENQEIIGKYKVKACESDKLARQYKKDCDSYLKQQGGQTTLDPLPEKEDEDDEP